MTLLSCVRDAFAPLVRYFSGDDPEGRARNSLAAIVSGNIPVYPIYVWLIAGNRAWPSLLAVLTIPLFALTPRAGRSGARAGRWMLLSAGLVDTGLCTKGLGPASGVELFYLPIVLLPAILYRDETLAMRAIMFGVVLLTFAAVRMSGASLEEFSSDELRNMVWFHAASVAPLVLTILVLRWRMPAATLVARA